MKFGESQGKDESIATFVYCEFAGMIQLNEGQELVAGYVPRDNQDDMVHLTDGVDRVANTGRAFAIGPNSSEEEIQALCMMMNYLVTPWRRATRSSVARTTPVWIWTGIPSAPLATIQN